MGKGDDPNCSAAAPMPHPADTGAGGLSFRAPTAEDERAVRCWVSDPACEEWLGGLEWAQYALEQEQPFIVCGPDGRAVAMVTGDIYDEWSVMLSLVVDPAARGRGIGAAALQQVIEQRLFGDRELRAEISWRNRASVATFMKARFVEDEPDYETRHSIWSRCMDDEERARERFEVWKGRGGPLEADYDPGEDW